MVKILRNNLIPHVGFCNFFTILTPFTLGSVLKPVGWKFYACRVLRKSVHEFRSYTPNSQTGKCQRVEVKTEKSVRSFNKTRIVMCAFIIAKQREWCFSKWGRITNLHVDGRVKVETSVDSAAHITLNLLGSDRARVYVAITARYHCLTGYLTECCLPCSSYTNK